MKVSAFLFAVCCGVGLFLALSAPRVVSARHTSHVPQNMFVFGDSFVDNGNLPRTDPAFEMSRQWHYPYGISYKRDDGSGSRPNATGRFSDFMVQSDFVAKMLGLPQSPPGYRSTIPHYCDPSGMNFATGGAAMYRNNAEVLMTVGEQVDLFESMIKGGTISKNRVTHSVALLAVSGNDYKTYYDSGRYDLTTMMENLTNDTVAIVERLRALGVKRVLVNNMHPIGCMPSWSRPARYKECDDIGNGAASEHNTNLKQKLGRKKGVLIVDLNTAFGNIIDHVHHDQGTKSYKQFKNTRKPCCEGLKPKDYCGQQSENPLLPLYSLCPDRSQFFFWDDANPTHAGWEAVMTQLEQPIKKFLGII